MDKVVELKKDIAELELLLNQASRQKVKDILIIEHRKLVTKQIFLEEKVKDQLQQTNGSSSTVSASSYKHYEVKINNYAWDQSDNFVRFYITLTNVQTIPAEDVTCEFTSNSINLYIHNLHFKDYTWQIRNLLKEIDPQKSSWKVKPDMVIINAAKRSPENWSHVTQWEKKASESKTPKMDDKVNPEDGLMSLMKNMYQTGDDEMKRTIAKAWTESKQKENIFL